MKNLIAIPIHSFVDLITNSSSELFVSSDNKTIEAVYEILQQLLHKHYKKCGEILNFNSVFGTIEVAKYSFDYFLIPQNIRETYEYYCNDIYPFQKHTFWESNKNPQKMELDRQDGELYRKCFHTDYLENLKKSNIEKYNDEYSKILKKYRKESDKIWKDWYINKNTVFSSIFYEFLKQNNFNKKLIIAAKRTINNKLKRNKYQRYFHFTFKNKELNDAFEQFQFYMSWEILVKKGSIFIHSNGDNSIPWEIMDEIGGCFTDIKRYHLG